MLEDSCYESGAEALRRPSFMLGTGGSQNDDSNEDLCVSAPAYTGAFTQSG